MFSATLSNDIKAIAKASLAPGYQYIDCVGKNEPDTHLKIKQSYQIAPYRDQLYLLQTIISKHKQSNPLAKVIVFCTHTSAVSFLGKALEGIPGMETLQLHGRLAQNVRSRISDQFRRSRSSILITTDVSARGVDYPAVTLVVQVGLPSSRDQYIHRIGRTGRGNLEGEAILILSPYERRYLEKVKDLPIREELRFNCSPNAQDKRVSEGLKVNVQQVEKGDRRNAYIDFISFRKFL